MSIEALIHKVDALVAALGDEALDYAHLPYPTPGIPLRAALGIEMSFLLAVLHDSNEIEVSMPLRDQVFGEDLRGQAAVHAVLGRGQAECRTALMTFDFGPVLVWAHVDMARSCPRVLVMREVDGNLVPHTAIFAFDGDMIDVEPGVYGLALQEAPGADHREMLRQNLIDLDIARGAFRILSMLHDGKARLISDEKKRRRPRYLALTDGDFVYAEGPSLDRATAFSEALGGQ